MGEARHEGLSSPKPSLLGGRGTVIKCVVAVVVIVVVVLAFVVGVLCLLLLSIDNLLFFMLSF